MDYDPEFRRYNLHNAPYSRDRECYISGEPFVLGECDLCKICEHGCQPRQEIQLIHCSGAEWCDCYETRTAHGEAIIIATDGACRNNGYANAEAAVGIFCNVDSNNNRSFVLNDARPTSQRAELSAAIHALREARNMFVNGNLHGKRLQEVVIKTDSAYLVNSMTTYIIKWRDNDYTNARGRPVVNQDLFRELDAICNRLNDIGIQARFWLVPRSQNMQADKLANAALDGIDWKDFNENDWFEEETKPYIHRRSFPWAAGDLYALGVYHDRHYDSDSDGFL